jgi:hypothetical protein
MRHRVGVVVLIVCGALLVAGVVVYGSGSHRLGGAILAVALIGVGLVIAPALSAEGRGAEAALGDVAVEEGVDALGARLARRWPGRGLRLAPGSRARSRRRTRRS